MSFLKNISIAGAVLGASMMFAGAAGAVTVVGGFTDTGNNGTIDGGTTAMGLGLSLSANSGNLDAGAGNFDFRFQNTATQTVSIIVSINDNPDTIWTNFTATLLGPDDSTVLDQFTDLPAPEIGDIFAGIVAAGDLFFLRLSWDSFIADGFAPTLSLQVRSDADLSIPGVPIPPSLVLFGSGLLGLGFLSARRRKKAISV